MWFFWENLVGMIIGFPELELEGRYSSHIKIVSEFDLTT
jgi:hypothetical protein